MNNFLLGANFKKKVAWIKSVSFVLACVALGVAAPARGMTYYYFSGGGGNGNWSTPGNWSVNGVPPGNSTNIGIVFLGGANNKTSILDIAGIMLRSVEFLQVTNHVITSPVARTLTLIGQGKTNPVVRFVEPSNLSYGRYILDSNIELVVSNQCLVQKEYGDYYSASSGSPNDKLIIAGRISGPGSLRFDQISTFNALDVTLQGSLGNTYTGPTFVTSGVTLYLDKSSGSAIPGNLVIENTYANVTWLRDNQVANTSSITNWGYLSLNGHSDTLGELHLIGDAEIQTAGSPATNVGLLTLGGDVYVENGDPLIYGRLALGTPAVSRVGRQFIIEAPGSLRIRGTISGTATLRKGGSGEFTLQASNSYSGLTVLEDGTTFIGHSNALGTIAASTYIGATALLMFDGENFNKQSLTCAEPLDIADHVTIPYFPKYAVRVDNTPGVSFTGPIHLEGDARFFAGPSSSSDSALRIFGPVEGPGRFMVTSGSYNDVSFEGTATNTYSGGTFVEGNLVLNRAGSGRSMPGSLFVSIGTVSAKLPNQFATNVSVIVSNLGQLMLSSNQSLASLNGDGKVWLGNLTLGSTGSNSLFAGNLQSGSLIKLGSGTLTLTGTNMYAGPTAILGGHLVVHGSSALSPISLSTGTTLVGTGIVGQVSGAGGAIIPGPGKARLSSASLSWAAAHTYITEIGGTNGGVDADVLRVTGGVNLGNAVLNASLSVGGKAGTKYLLIDNDGNDAVVGTFNGLPQGAPFALNGIQFQISYTGGTGNDVVLTQLSTPPQPTFNGGQQMVNGQFQIRGTGLPGFTYEVEATTSLNPPAWVSLGTTQANGQSGLIQFVDPDANLLPMRFYRFVLP